MAQAEASESKPYLWRTTAIVALVVAVPSFIYTVVQLYDRFTRVSGPEFVVDADYDNFTLPPQLLAAIQELDRSRVKKDDNVLVLNPDGKGELERQFDTLQGYLTFSMRNAGNVAATNVRVQTKSEGFAIVKWDDGKTENVAFTNDIPIGTVAIEKTVTVSAWTKDRLSADSPPLVVHGTGSVPVVLPEKRVPISAAWTALVAIATASIIVIGSRIYSIATLSDKRLLMALEKRIFGAVKRGNE